MSLESAKLLCGFHQGAEAIGGGPFPDPKGPINILEDCVYTVPGMEPEMLMQPKTRPLRRASLRPHRKMEGIDGRPFLGPKGPPDIHEDSTYMSTQAEPEMLLQPETPHLSHEQLVVEVKGIYAGLVMVEAKCIDIDKKQTAAAYKKDLTQRVQVESDQWQYLIALHKQVGAMSHFII